MSHPYRKQPATAFWSASVARDFHAEELAHGSDILIGQSDVVVSAGSCFAANIVPYLEQAGLTYLRTEQPHPAFAHLGENLGYRGFSAAFGNIYTARQLRQLLNRALGTFRPEEDRWRGDGFVIDPFRPGLRFPARSDREFDVLTAQHLRAVREAFERATVFVFTLGLTEGWASSLDGAVYPTCPGTVAGTFDATRHRFHNFTVAEVRDDLVASIETLRGINPAVRVVLTVSPVPLVATATDDHVVVATTYSKSVLRVAAGEVAQSLDAVTYFPAYEIITGPQAPADYFEPDRRSVSSRGVAAVMDALLTRCETGAPHGEPTHAHAVQAVQPVEPPPSPATADDNGPSDAAAALSEAVSTADCDLALLDLYADDSAAS